MHYFSSVDDKVEAGAASNYVAFGEASASDFNFQEESKSRWPTTFCTQYKTLTTRQFKISKNYIFNRFNFIKYTALTIYTSLMWWQVPRIEEKLDDKFALVSK